MGNPAFLTRKSNCRGDRLRRLKHSVIDKNAEKTATIVASAAMSRDLQLAASLRLSIKSSDKLTRPLLGCMNLSIKE
jgi:hypothetical protein